jgi:hypothetical protein
MGTNSLRHHQNERPIIQVQLIASSNELILTIARAWVVRFGAKIRLIEAGMSEIPINSIIGGLF